LFFEDEGIIFLQTVVPSRNHEGITRKATVESLPYPISCCFIRTSLIQDRRINYRPGKQPYSGEAGSLFVPDTLEEWLPRTLQTSAPWLKLRSAPREWLNHDWTRKTLQFAVRRNLENYQSEHCLPSFTTHTNNMLFIIIWRCVYLYVMSLRELCGTSTDHDACAHELSVSSSPSKCEFRVTLASDRQCHEYLVHGVVFGRITVTQYETRCNSDQHCCYVCLDSRNDVSFMRKFLIPRIIVQILMI